MTQSIPLVLALLALPLTTSADTYWRLSDAPGSAPRGVAATRGATLHLDRDGIAAALAQAPAEGDGPGVEILLPWPDGTLERYTVFESPVAAPELVAQYPDLRTWAGRGVDDGTATVKLDLTRRGFHAQVLSARGVVYVNPWSDVDLDHYVAFFKHDLTPPDPARVRCLVDGEMAAGIDWPRGRGAGEQDQAPHGTSRRTFRLAVAATGEYTAYHGGTVAGGLAAIATTIHRVNGILERDLAVRLVLIGSNASIVYTNENTDPYTNHDKFAMLNENQIALNAVIGSANFDFGHVFGTSGGGVAMPGPCVSTKARGVTGAAIPEGDAFDVDFVAHEMGHQLGAEHTFNGSSWACAGNRHAGSAYEPGSGSTIMGYSGSCTSENLQVLTDPYYHARSLEQMVEFVTTNGAICGEATPLGNVPPVVDAGGDHAIPVRTTFELTGSATDADGDALTYTWEEMDLGAESPPSTDADGVARPIFRSFLPGPSPTRTFPRPGRVTAFPELGESLPTIARTMWFRLTSRDGAGGTASDDMRLTVVAAGGPFRVTWPDRPLVVGGNTTKVVTWDVALTTAWPVSVSTVRIRLSTDGGVTFPVELAPDTPNDGAHAVVVPNVATTTARIRVEAIGNVFFDVSDANFTIDTSGLPVASIGDARVDEGDAGTRTATFDVTLDAAPGAATATVSWSTGIGTATAGVDYSAASGTLTFTGAETAKQVAVVVHADALDEVDETFPVALSAPAGLVLSDPVGTGTIADDDASPTVAVSSARTLEGTGGANQLAFDGTLSTVSGRTVTVGYATVDGSAHSGVGGDFTARSGTLIFGAGETVRTFVVPLTTDAVDEPEESFGVVLSNADGAVVAGGSGTGTIVDDDAGPSTNRDRLNDFGGDGKADLAVLHVASGDVYVRDSASGATLVVGFGAGELRPVPADYDTDRVTDLAAYHPSTGTWTIRSSLSSTTSSSAFGGVGYAPVRGDYDGDGRNDLAVFHEETGLWFLKGSRTGTVQTIGYGGSGYVPVPADYDGSRATDLGVYHPPSGLWFLRLAGATTTVGFGGPDYAPLRGDFTGDGRSDVAVFHAPSGHWYVKDSTSGGVTATGLGTADYTTVPGDYDGDNVTDLAVYHEPSGLWFTRSSALGTVTATGFGGPGFTPLN